MTSVVFCKERKLGRFLLIALSLCFFGGLITVVPPGTALGTTEPPSANPTVDGEAQGEVTAELPPPDIPTSNQQGYTFNLKSSLRADLDALPK